MKRILVICVIVIMTFGVLVACDSSNNNVDDSIEPVEPIGFSIVQIEDTQQIEVTWGKTEYAVLDITVTHGNQVVNKKSVDAQKEKQTVLDAYYGKHQVTIVGKDANSVVIGEETQEVVLSADEYVIAPIAGSMPQLYFTLYMAEITKDYTIPAFVWLTRPGSWNWDNLPKNVYPMPNADRSEVLKHDNYNKMVDYTDAYIEELFSVNEQSKFNLYINDFNSYLYLKLLAGNGIPEENYTVTLLSDGGASYVDFNEAFNSNDPQFDADEKYEDMSLKLEKTYEEVRTAKDYYWGDFTVDTTAIRQYSYVAAKEKDNVEWWLLRPREGVLCSPDADFINTVLTTDKTEGIIEERNFEDPLKNLSKEQESALKALYSFDNDMFEEAKAQDKKVMMILGSWAKADNEPYFEAYVRFIKLYYGDEFVYYYKGHPHTPTELYPSKQKQLKNLDLIDVKSSINAELILFFCPDIYMCGYNSSTFMSVEAPELAQAMFNMKKDECTAECKDIIGMFLSKIDVSKSKYKSLCKNSKHSYFLVEYNDGSNMIGIYDDTARTIKNYKVENNKFIEVK